jgi:glycosidase
VLTFYKRLLHLRHCEKALLDGQYVALDETNPNVLSFLRQQEDEAVLVVLNLSESPQAVTLNLARQGLGRAKPSTLLASAKTAMQASAESITVGPFGVYIVKLTK